MKPSRKLTPPNDALRRARLQHGWSQEQLAERLGTNAFTVCRWERGSAFPSLYYRQQLGTLFALPPAALGLLPGQEPQAPPQSFWQVPYPRNPHFTGREELLTQLEQQFSPAGADRSVTPRRVALTQPQAITGLGGIGKTQIAVEYAYRAFEQGRYTHVLWLNAASEEAILSSFLTLAELLPAGVAREETDQHHVMEAIKRWLEQCPHPWLLICDNADDVSLLHPYLPHRGNGSLLLTTRSHAIGSLAAPIEVENMGLVEGTLFLLQRAQRQQASGGEREEATNIVIALEGFPLALDQAGAYIEETGCSFADYLQTYQEHHRFLLARRGGQATNYPDSVATTWLLSFEQIATSNPAAAELLRLCAFLAPNAIPEELFKEGAAYWPPALQEAVTKRLSFQGLLEALLRFSLIKRLGGERILSLHRLVQVVQRDMVEAEEQRHWAERVVRAVHALFPADPKANATCWPQCLQYLEQAQACDRLIKEYQLLLPEAAELLDRAGTYLSEHASYTLAEPLFQRAYAIREVQSTFPLNSLADLYQKQGKYEQAESLYQRTLSMREQYVGPEHPLLADPLTELGHVSYHQGKYEQVERFYQRALSIRKQQLGETHPLVAKILGWLARFYTRRGRFAEAEPLFQRTLLILEQQVGETHLDLAVVLYGLADLYRLQGRFAEAKPLLQRAISIREQLLGETHPDLALPLQGLAQVYSSQDRYAEAEPLYQRVLAIWEQQLGPEHSLVAYPLAGLAEIALNQRKYAEAEPLYRRVLAIWEQQLGPEHSLVAYPLAALVKLYKEEGRFAEAEPLLQRALLILERTPDDQPLITAQTLEYFAELRAAQRRYEEAALFAERALAIREQVLGAEHPRTKEARERLCVALGTLERSEATEKEREAHLEPPETREVEQAEAGSGECRSVLPACPRCQGTSVVVKSGTNKSGSPRFRCQRCQRYFTPQFAARQDGRDQKEQAVLLAKQGKSYRFIARQMGVNHRTISAWIQASKRDGDSPGAMP